MLASSSNWTTQELWNSSVNEMLKSDQGIGKGKEHHLNLLQPSVNGEGNLGSGLCCRLLNGALEGAEPVRPSDVARTSSTSY